MRVIILFLSFGLLVANAYAEVYRWTDEQGNVHFGDKPPVTREVEEVKIQKAPTPVPGSDSASRLKAQQKLLNAYREERIKEQDAQREAAAKQAEQNRRCVEARNDLMDYERSSGIYDMDEEGNRIYMNDSEREAFIQKLRVDIQRYCD